jgi:hypothetical protein
MAQIPDSGDRKATSIVCRWGLPSAASLATSAGAANISKNLPHPRYNAKPAPMGYKYAESMSAIDVENTPTLLVKVSTHDCTKVFMHRKNIFV